MFIIIIDVGENSIGFLKFLKLKFEKLCAKNCCNFGVAML